MAKSKKSITTTKKSKSKKSTQEPIKVVTVTNSSKGAKPGVIYTHIYEREANDMSRLKKWHRSSRLDNQTLLHSGAFIPEIPKEIKEGKTKKTVQKISGFKKSKKGIEPIKKE